MIRLLRRDDLVAVLKVSRNSLEAGQWTAEHLEPALRGEQQAWVAEQNERVLGFVVSRCAADEMEILNLAVAPERRRCGLGSRLLETALDQGRHSGARRAFLEVRESNQTAISFYLRFGFCEVGRRSRYYANPVEDALVLAKKFPVNSP